MCGFGASGSQPSLEGRALVSFEHPFPFGAGTIETINCRDLFRGPSDFRLSSSAYTGETAFVLDPFANRPPQLLQQILAPMCFGGP